MLKDDKKKERVAKFEEKNSGRYSWLLDIKDADKNPIGNGDICIYLSYSVDLPTYEETDSNIWLPT